MAEIDKRIENIANFFKKNEVLLQYLALILVILIGVYVRVQPLDKLIDTTTGDYISIELDSTIFLEYAEYIAENDKLFTVDAKRNYPVGADISSIGLFTSYFIAYLYKLLHVFIPSITVAYVDVIYPIIATVILSIFLFLLVRRIFNYKVALLSCLFVNILPTFLFRSLGGSSDHDVLVMMFTIMAFYFYVAALQAKKLRNNILFGAIAGILTFLGKYSGGSATFILLILGVTALIIILFNSFNKKDLYVYISWIVTFSLLVLIFNLDHGLMTYINSLGTLPAYLALLVIIINLFVVKKDLFKIHTRLSKKFPEGVTSFLLALILGFAFMLIAYGPAFFVDKFNQLVAFIFHFYAGTRWTLTVAENRKLYVVDWISQFGWVYFLAFLAGIVVLFYKATSALKSKAKLTALFAVFIFLYIFSGYSPQSVFNGDSTAAKVTFYGSFLIFFGLMIYFYLRSFYKNTEDYHNITKIKHEFVFIFIWFFILVLGATGAVRLLFEFSLITAVLAAYLFAFVFDYFLTIKYNILKYAGILLILFLLFSPLSFAKGVAVKYYESTYNQAAHIGPGYNVQWQTAGKWVRENTPEGSVFAHWWDYGYWVQAGFDRPTMLDGGNMFGWWNYLMARHVLTGQNYTEPLKYLYAHNASYLLIISDDIGKYPAYASIGGDINNDRYSYITSFVIDESASQETRNGSVLLYRGVFPLEEDFVYDNKVYPAGRAGIAGVLVPLVRGTEQIGNETMQKLGIQQPIAILIYNNQQINLPLKCVYIDNQVITFENYAYEGCFRLVPVVQNNQVHHNAGGFFLSKRTANSLFTRLYLFDEPNPYFTLVYDDSAVYAPVALHSGGIVGPLKIWKINYPNDISLTEEEKQYYMMRDYPDPALFSLS